VQIDDELKKEMSPHPEVDWVEVAIKAIRNCIRDRENCKFLHTLTDKAMSQDRKRRSKSPNIRPQKLRALHSELS
jgi:hypothetical protein